MAVTLYRFRTFKLDTEARELHCDGELVTLPVSALDCLIYLVRHRHRTIGRDELTAAVWGCVEISEVSLSHTIMRLRRLLGDTGNEQNSIRTLPRLGYRWIVEPTVEEVVAPAANRARAEAEAATSAAPDAAEPATEPAAEPVAESAEPAAEPRSNVAEAAVRSGVRRKAGLALLLLGLVALLAFALTSTMRTPGGYADAESDAHLSAMVLPAEVDAGDEWTWLRFGFMDLIANRLRSGDLATMPSETVVGLMNARRLDATGEFHGDPPSGASMMRIRPHAALVNGLWNVRLEARGDGRDVVAVAQAKDVVTAGRAVADNLLVKLGHAPPHDAQADPSIASEELAQRVNAAVLTGQLQVAATLIREAPEAVRGSPEIALSAAAIEFFAGDYEASREHAEALLDQLPADAAPVQHARAC
ncbi:MAG TPA: winged helix-turn-helix domain-containing protein [Dokdonella sp.]